MPVSSEKDWVHVRLRKSLADQLRVIAKREHRYGIQVETNLAVETYIRKSMGVVVYGVFKKGRCIYVGATNNLAQRAMVHWKKYGPKCRIEIFYATLGVNRAIEIERKYIQKFKALGQADFNLVDTNGPSQRFDPITLQDSLIKEFANELRENG